MPLYSVCFAFCLVGLIRESDAEEEEDDTIHMGNAIMTFYAALIDLLGRCAPEMHVRVGRRRRRGSSAYALPPVAVRVAATSTPAAPAPAPPAKNDAAA